MGEKSSKFWEAIGVSCMALVVFLWLLFVANLPMQHTVASKVALPSSELIFVHNRVTVDTFSRFVVVGNDKRWCELPKATFDSVAPGAMVLCIWRKGSENN